MFKFDLGARVLVGDDARDGVVVGRNERLGEAPSYEVDFDDPAETGGRMWIGEGALTASKKKAPPRKISPGEKAAHAAANERVPMARSRPAPRSDAEKAAMRARLEAVAANAGETPRP